MPLIVKQKGEVVYEPPHQRPVIGRLVFLNTIVEEHRRRVHVAQLSKSMSIIQSALLRREK